MVLQTSTYFGITKINIDITTDLHTGIIKRLNHNTYMCVCIYHMAQCKKLIEDMQGL